MGDPESRQPENGVNRLDPVDYAFGITRIDRHQLLGLQLAASATFYNPDYHSDRHKIHMEAGAYTNTDYQATYSYPWLTGTFEPENASRLPGYPTSNFVSMLPAL